MGVKRRFKLATFEIGLLEASSLTKSPGRGEVWRGPNTFGDVLALGQNAAASQSDPSSFNSLRDRKCISGQKTLVQQADSSDLHKNSMPYA